MKKALTIEAKNEKLDQVLDFVNEMLEELGCSIKDQNRIDIAVEEVFVNIANYAYGEETGEMTLSAETAEAPKSLTLSFFDSGIPYDPLAKEDPDITLPASERPIGGLGIFMVKNIADELSYEYKDGQNVFTFVKRF